MEHQFPLLFPRRGKPTSVGGVVDFARKRNHLFIRQPAEATPPSHSSRAFKEAGQEEKSVLITTLAVK